MTIVSNCCGAVPRSHNDDLDSTDLGICPSCGEHCEFIDEDRPECPNTKYWVDSRDPAYDDRHRYVAGKCIGCGALQYDPADYAEDY